MNTTFYVHIIESLAPEELLYDFGPGRALAEFLKLSGIPYQYNNVVDQERFRIALKDRVLEGFRDHKVNPILHLAMHGSENGLQLTHQRNTDQMINWPDLASMLLPIHQGLGNNLGVCMSSCKGLHGLNMANTDDHNSIPYSWLVGFESDVQWRDLALAYAIFYRRYQGGTYGQHLLDAVKAASGINGFGVAEGKIMQANYSQLLFQKQMDELRQLLEVPTS